MIAWNVNICACGIWGEIIHPVLLRSVTIHVLSVRVFCSACSYTGVVSRGLKLLLNLFIVFAGSRNIVILSYW